MIEAFGNAAITAPMWVFVLLSILFFVLGYCWGKDFWISTDKEPPTTFHE